MTRTTSQIARQAAAMLPADEIDDLPLAVAGEQMAKQFVDGLADPNALPDELYCILMLFGTNQATNLRWFLRAVQARIQELQAEAGGAT